VLGVGGGKLARMICAQSAELPLKPVALNVMLLETTVLQPGGTALMYCTYIALKSGWQIRQAHRSAQCVVQSGTTKVDHVCIVIICINVRGGIA